MFFFLFLKEENHLLIVENRTHQAHVLQVHNKRENFKKNSVSSAKIGFNQIRKTGQVLLYQICLQEKSRFEN